MKKTLSVILSLIMIMTTLAALPFTASANTSGSAGSNTKFEFDSSTGVMTFTGNGPIEMTGFDDVGFSRLTRQIKKMVFKDGVTSINVQYFESLPSLKELDFQSVKVISVEAFMGCYNLENVNFKVIETIGEDAFLNCKNLRSVTVPDTLKKIDVHAFGFYGAPYNGTVSYTLYDDYFYIYSSCSNKAAENYVNEYKDLYTDDAEICWEPRHDFNNAGKIVQKASFDYQLGTIEHSCNYGCGTVEPERIDWITTIKLSNTKYTYNGKAKTPAVTVLDRVNKKLKNGTDYTVTYSNNVKVGKATATVKFKGKYEGTKRLTFYIFPKGTSIKKLSGKKGKVAAVWKKQATQTTGYKIEVSSKSNFPSKATNTYTVKSYKTTKAVLTQLPRKKKLYVRIRTYKTVAKKNYYSEWSAVKTVKTK